MSASNARRQRRASQRATVLATSTSPGAPYKRGRVASSAWSHKSHDGSRSLWGSSPYYFDAVEVDRRWSK